MEQFILQENVLSDNILLIPDHGKRFKGGYIAIIKEFQFETAWSDKMIIKRFRTQKSLNSYISKKYPDFQEI